MKNSLIFHKKNQTPIDLYIKLNFININQYPQIKKIQIKCLNLTKKKKKILFYLVILSLLFNQQIFLNLKKNKKLKNNCIFFNLSYKNQFNFLFNFLFLYLPNTNNLNKLKGSFFKTGNFFYFFNNSDFLIRTLNLNNFLNLKFLYQLRLNFIIKFTTKNNFISKIYLSTLIFPF